MVGVLGCLLSVVSVVAVWARGQVLDTDRYVATVAPLASDPVVQDAVAARVTAVIDQHVDAFARSGLPKGTHGLPVAAVAHQVVQQETLAYVRSPAFRTLWVTVNTVGHRQLVHVLTGRGSEPVSVESGQLVLDLGPVVAAVRDRLAGAGQRWVRVLPTITLVVDLGNAGRLQKARTAVRWLDALAFWLPFVTVALLAAAVVLARRRRGAMLWACGGVLVAMVALLLAVRLGSSVVPHHVPRADVSRAVVRAMYRALTRTLRRDAVGVAIVAAAAGAIVLVVGRRARPSSAR